MRKFLIVLGCFDWFMSREYKKILKKCLKLSLFNNFVCPVVSNTVYLQSDTKKPKIPTTSPVEV